MKSFPTLFKFAKSGAVQQWNINVNAIPGGQAAYTVIYGQVGGALQSTTTRVKSGKNLGKKNATTPYEQALSEAESKWKAQLDKGYAQSAPKPLARTSPMLAKSYEKEMAKVTFPCYFQPKLDGVRCIAEKVAGVVTLFSRKGKVFDTLDNITSILEDIMDDGDILDGELYVHGVPFQTAISWIKRKQDNTKRVVYNVYDAINDQPFAERLKRICDLVGHKGKGVIKTVHTARLHSHAEVKCVLEEQEARGYEGIMLRIDPCAYQVGRRSSQLLKVKSFIDDEFEIVGAEENKGRQKGQCVFICKTKDGATFKVKPMGTEAQRQKMWQDHEELIGEQMTVRFFEWTTSTPPVPRFPIGVAIRDYED